jgi:hypothetical protein
MGMKLRMILFQSFMGLNALLWLVVLGEVLRPGGSGGQSNTLLGLVIAGLVVAAGLQHYAFRNLRQPHVHAARAPGSFKLDPRSVPKVGSKG